MRRPNGQDAEAPGQDSFLDVVTNMVGIVIILVMVVGMRVKHAPAKPVSGAASTTPAIDLSEDLATERALREDVAHATGEIASVEREALVLNQARDRLATVLALGNHELQSRREGLDATAKAQFDLNRQLVETRAQLEQLAAQRSRLESSRPETIKLEALPTPISRTVDDKEGHFQIRGGLIAFIPLNDLLDKFKSDAREQVWRLRDQDEFSDTVGPLGGFRLRYTLERVDLPLDRTMRSGGGSYARLARWTLIPISNQVGEPLEIALGPQSEFRRSVASLGRRATTVTLWTYQDSFGTFRRLREELHRLGYTVAGRPLPEDVPIGGSPQGSKSAAE
ncbi:MAG: hypothetical protein ACYC35_10560 [Pirellulales bacterium]